MTRIGFTGTRNGMTRNQKNAVLVLLLDLGADEFHHGDCVGADAEAHQIATNLGCRVVVHPPEEDRLRAFCQSRVQMPKRKYLDRNLRIIDMTDVLIAAPGEDREIRRSGTWSTIRRASDLGKQVIVVYPSGETIREGGPNDAA